MAARKPGRRCKLTAERRKTICRAIADGLTYDAAAGLAGVSVSTPCAWLKKGEAKPGEDGFAPVYRGFLRHFTRARAEGEEALIARVAEGVNAKGDPDWKASAWILERRWRDGFGMRALEARRAEAEIRQLEAEAKMAEAKAKLADSQSAALSQGLAVDLGGDDGELLWSGITPEDIAEASPTPLPEGVELDG